MSSFVGHGLAAFTIGKSLQSGTGSKFNLFWQIWLIISALAPDIDYLVLRLNAPHNGGIRITHSIAFSLILPFLGVICLFLFDRKNIIRGGLQACLAGVSHLFMDALVGSRQGDPWLYPFLPDTYRLMVGVLPSSATISLRNFYFYRNLIIECGILIPVSCFILNFTGKIKLKKLTIIGLMIVFIIFLIWSINLSR